jgi:hypothetical protein
LRKQQTLQLKRLKVQLLLQLTLASFDLAVEAHAVAEETVDVAETEEDSAEIHAQNARVSSIKRRSVFAAWHV